MVFRVSFRDEENEVGDATIDCTFKDAAGEVWDAAINISAAKRLRDRLGINVRDFLTDVEEITKWVVDPINCCDVAYVICEPQCDERGMSDQDFGKRFGGDQVLPMRDAILNGITCYFTDPERSIVEKIVRAARDCETRRQQEVVEMISDGSLDKIMDSAVEMAEKEFQEKVKSLTTSPGTTSK